MYGYTVTLIRLVKELNEKKGIDSCNFSVYLSKYFLFNPIIFFVYSHQSSVQKI